MKNINNEKKIVKLNLKMIKNGNKVLTLSQYKKKIFLNKRYF